MLEYPNGCDASGFYSWVSAGNHTVSIIPGQCRHPQEIKNGIFERKLQPVTSKESLPTRNTKSVEDGVECSLYFGLYSRITALLQPQVTGIRKCQCWPSQDYGAINSQTILVQQKYLNYKVKHTASKVEFCQALRREL